MSKLENQSFTSIAQLCLDSQYSIAEIASAIELVGFYTWDKLGRFIYVLPKEKIQDDFRKLYEDLLEHLSEVIRGGYEFDEDYFQKSSQGLENLKRCGWPSLNLPDFGEQRIKWNEKYLGKNIKAFSLQSVTEQEPATQSKVWDLVAGLIKLSFEDEFPNIIDDLTSGHSKHLNTVCAKLLTEANVSITTKTLKNYLSKKG
ncbi:hypothetical protein R2103_05000 [Nitrosomonas sp. Is24]|uniref:hypothetical protein n=1 Tax=Nitrosomonas sp. Is24 TaxID=3080533 RepID=UPI00294AB8AA|nr:hypothetical protein [Nitrosomonas sp. Is24]MDV6341125.1 hypothetical protein [Nitrosomonas sp. Is24]